MYTLYYMPGACSLAVHVALKELGQDVKLENASSQPRPAALLKINPRGNVPVLVDDGFVVREGAAILVYLLEKHKSKLLPESGKERATALEWLMFCNATLHPACGRVFGAMKMEGNVKDVLVKNGTENLNRLWADVEARLGQTPYLAGQEVTIADILLTVIANWSVNMPEPIRIGAKTKELLKKISSRPAYQQAMKDEQIEYKVAA